MPGTRKQHQCALRNHAEALGIQIEHERAKGDLDREAQILGELKKTVEAIMRIEAEIKGLRSEMQRLGCPS